MIILRESHVHVKLFLSLLTYYLIFKARDKRIGAQGQRMVLTLAALECLTVHKAFIIQNDLVTVLCCTVYYGHTRIFVTLFVDEFIHIRIGHFAVRFLNLHALVFTDLCFRIQSHFRRKYERLACFQCHDVDLRTGYDLFFALIVCFLVSIRDRIIYSIAVKEIFSVHLLDDLTGYLALTEPRYIDLVLISSVCSFYEFIKLVLCHLNGQLRHIVL